MAFAGALNPPKSSITTDRQTAVLNGFCKTAESTAKTGSTNRLLPTVLNKLILDAQYFFRYLTLDKILIPSLAFIYILPYYITSRRAGNPNLGEPVYMPTHPLRHNLNHSTP
jgi:hypothetical protein